jgi:hypothetical protein
MTWIDLLGLGITALKSVLGYIDPKVGPLAQEIYTEVEAALAKLTAVHGKAVTLADLETLRTKKLW